MSVLRRVLFWCHLTAGVLAGGVVLVMSATGAALSLQKPSLRLVEGRVRHVAVEHRKDERLPAGALLRRASRSAGSSPSTLSILSDPSEAAVVGFKGGRTLYVDPTTGAPIGEGSRALREFFTRVEDVHRRLATGDARGSGGRAVTGAANALFLGLAFSGLFLWWPRQKGAGRFSRAATFQRSLSGRARDFNWHSVTGFWLALPLLVITSTGVVMSYRWANDLLYRLAGSEPPPEASSSSSGNSGRKSGGGREGVSPEAATTLDRLWKIAEMKAPGWRAITLRLPENETGTVTFSIEEGAAAGAFARSQLTLDPATDRIVRWEPFAKASAGRHLRTWARFAHTGEVWGPAGQVVATAASLGGVFLAWTGLSLALRRLRSRRSRSLAAGEQAQAAVALDDISISANGRRVASE